MFLLDTDYAGIIQRKTEPAFSRLKQRTSAHDLTDFYFPIVAFHEQVMGANLYISRARNLAGVVHGYHLMQEVLVHFRSAQVLPFDDPAADTFEQLRKQRIRIGTMDLRIASIALGNDLTVLTRNVRDFQQVPNLRVEDWTV